MKFENLLPLIGDLPWFDLATVVQLTDEPRATITNQLSRWLRAGKVIPLRRGMYILGESYRKTAAGPASIANAMYVPSYLSGAFALSFWGLIPESTSVYTSVTTRKPRTFENSLGTFQYRNVKRSMFFGYVPITVSGQRVRMATPEKALVDYWYLSTGEWGRERIREMRLPPDNSLDMVAVSAAVKRSGKPRLDRALWAFEREMRQAREGMVEL